MRGSKIWVEGSRDYQAFENYLLPAEAGRDTGINGRTDPGRYIAIRTAELRERLTFVAKSKSQRVKPAFEILRSSEAGACAGRIGET